MNIFILSITGLRFNLISHIRECGSFPQPQGTRLEERGASVMKHVLNWLASCWHQNGWQLSQTNPKRNTFNHLSLGIEDSSIHLGCDQKVISPFCSKQWNGIIPVSCCCLLLLVVAIWCSRRPLGIQSVSLSFPSPFLV